MVFWNIFGPKVIVPEYTSACAFVSLPMAMPQTLHLISG
jgi:hypothetical protein